MHKLKGRTSGSFRQRLDRASFSRNQNQILRYAGAPLKMTCHSDRSGGSDFCATRENFGLSSTVYPKRNLGRKSI